MNSNVTLLEAVCHFRSVVIDARSRRTSVHAHQCCRFQGYPKAVSSQMKLTMREPASMTTDKGSPRVTSSSNSVLKPVNNLNDSLYVHIIVGLMDSITFHSGLRFC